MKLGVCTSIENAGMLKDIGFDYVELGLSGIAALSDEEFTRLLEASNSSPLKPFAYNVLLPGTIKVTGSEVNYEIIREYLIKAFGRVKSLGGKLVVFGSGGSRRVPEGFPYEEAFSQLVNFLKLAAPIAEENGITIIIEPLRAAETNIVNTASEGLKLAKEVNHPNVRLLIDFFHMACEKESPDIILEAGTEYLKHLHIANPEGRVWPKAPEEADYAPFFSNLKKIGYVGTLSIEGRTENIAADAPVSFGCLKELIK